MPFLPPKENAPPGHLMDAAPSSPADEVLFHYCGAEQFLSILKNREVWLSGISLANDTMEGRIVEETLLRLADESGLSLDQRAQLRDAIQMVGRLFEGFAFCLSRAPDLLSQWRGYGADGGGYAIGFSRHYLERLVESRGKKDYRPQIGEVVYRSEEHDQLAKPLIDQLLKLAKADELSFGFRFGGLLSYPLPPLEQVNRDKKYKDAHLTLFLEAVKACRSLQFLKQSGFAEEKEVRLIAPLFSAEDFVNYRARGQDLVPYVSLELTQFDGISTIREVWTGPKNRTPSHLVEAALTRYGWKGATVIRSSTTYR